MSAWLIRSADTTGPIVVSDACSAIGPELRLERHDHLAALALGRELGVAGRGRRRGRRRGAAPTGWGSAMDWARGSAVGDALGLGLGRGSGWGSRSARPTRKPTVKPPTRKPTETPTQKPTARARAAAGAGAGRRRERRVRASPRRGRPKADRLGLDVHEAVACSNDDRLRGRSRRRPPRPASAVTVGILEPDLPGRAAGVVDRELEPAPCRRSAESGG